MRRVDGVEVDVTILHRSLGNLGGPNSDHPSCCDVALGERLRKDIYEALRAGPGSVWKSKFYGA